MALRSCAAKYIFNSTGQMLVGKRSSSKSTEVGKWQFPQGGVQGDELGLTAAYREITEEIGLTADHLQLAYTLPSPLIYKFDDILKEKDHIGQTVQWFVFFMKNPDLSQCYLNNEDPPEFVEVKWTDWDTLFSETVTFKLDMFKQLRSLVEPEISNFLQVHNTK